MGVSFEYNLGEQVSFGSRDLILRRAVSGIYRHEKESGARQLCGFAMVS